MKKFVIVFVVALSAMFVMPKLSEAGIITPPDNNDVCSEDTCEDLQDQINGKCSQAQCAANTAAIATKCSQAQCNANTAAIATKCSQAQCNANSAAITANTDMIDMVKQRFRLVNNVCDRESQFVNRIAVLQEASCDANCDSDEQVTGCSFECFNTTPPFLPINCYRLSVLESGPINAGQGCTYRVVNNNVQNNIVGNARVQLSVTAHCAQVTFP